MRFGIIGTGRIAKRFVPECLAVPGTEIPAVYNPHTGSAERFVREVWQGPDRPESLNYLDALWDQTDVVYIASPHETHYNYIMQSLEHGKHVLCEKPMVLKAAEADEAFKAAEAKGLILMEGIKTAYCPGYRKVLELAESGMIGEVRYADACFTKLEGRDTRELTDRRYGGSFTELGSYVMLPILDVFGSSYDSIRFSQIKNEYGIDIFTRFSLTYPGGIASAECGLGAKSEGRLIISGTEGYIKADAPWWKTRHIEVHFEDEGKTQVYDEPFEGDGLRYEIKEFMEQAEGQGKEKAQRQRDRSLCMADMMERFLKGRTETV